MSILCLIRLIRCKSNIEGDLKQGSQAASIVADTRRARHRVPVGADYSHLIVVFNVHCGWCDIGRVQIISCSARCSLDLQEFPNVSQARHPPVKRLSALDNWDLSWTIYILRMAGKFYFWVRIEIAVKNSRAPIQWPISLSEEVENQLTKKLKRKLTTLTPLNLLSLGAFGKPYSNLWKDTGRPKPAILLQEW